MKQSKFITTEIYYNHKNNIKENNLFEVTTD